MKDFEEVFEENQSEYSGGASVYNWHTWEEFCDAIIYVCEDEIEKVLDETYDVAGYYEGNQHIDIYEQIYNMTTVGTHKFQRVDVDRRRDDGSIVPAGFSMIKGIVGCFTAGIGIDDKTSEKLLQRIGCRLSEDISEDNWASLLSEKILDVRETYRIEHDFPFAGHWSGQQEAGQKRE